MHAWFKNLGLVQWLWHVPSNPGVSYCIVQKFDVKNSIMEAYIDEHNFDDLIVGFMGETLREKV